MHIKYDLISANYGSSIITVVMTVANMKRKHYNCYLRMIRIRISVFCYSNGFFRRALFKKLPSTETWQTSGLERNAWDLLLLAFSALNLEVTQYPMCIFYACEIFCMQEDLHPRSSLPRSYSVQLARFFQ